MADVFTSGQTQMSQTIPDCQISQSRLEYYYEYCGMQLNSINIANREGEQTKNNGVSARAIHRMQVWTPASVLHLLSTLLAHYAE